MIATKYLGVDLQSTLSWKTHIDRISKKANIMLGFLSDRVVRTQRTKHIIVWSDRTWSIARKYGIQTRDQAKFIGRMGPVQMEIVAQKS